VHGLVTGGGLSPDGRWVAGRNGLLLPARVVRAVCRGQRLAAIRQAWAREALAWPEGLQPQPMRNRLTRLGQPRKTTWNVRIMARYRHGAGVVTDLARSRRGGPIQTARLVACDGARVTFTRRTRPEEADGGSPAAQRLTFSVADVLQRGLLQVPAPQTRVIRGDGLSHHPHAPARAGCRAALGQPPVEAPPSLDGQTVGAQHGEAHPEQCPTGGQVLVCTGGMPRGGAPPGVWAGERAA
jgi:Putative transposase